MINHSVEITILGATAESIYDFMITPNDQRYSDWWPEEHLQFHIVRFGDKEHLGDEVYYDEYLGKQFRLKFFAVVITATRPNQIIWQMKKAGFLLPAFLNFQLYDSPQGLQLKHELKLGYNGIARLLDPFIRLYFSKSMQAALEIHCRCEWLRLVDYLNSEG